MEYGRRICVALLLMTCAATVGYAWAQPKQGVVVEGVDKNLEGEKAGLQEGDVVLSWSRGDDKGELESPFDLSLTEIEQAPRGKVTLEGLRSAEKRIWVLGPNDWGLKTRPDLPPDLLSIYLEGQELAKAGKLTQAAEHWRQAARQAQGNHAPWLGTWFRFREGALFADAKQWKEADAAYQEGLQQATGIGSEIVAQLIREWGTTYAVRGDRENADKYFQQSLLKSQESPASSLIAANNLDSLGVSAWESNDLPKAEKYIRQGWSIRQKIAPDSPGMGVSLHLLSLVARSGNNLVEAEEYERQALAIYEKFDPVSQYVAGGLNALASIALDRGDLSRAEEYCWRALAIGEKLPPSILGMALPRTLLGNLALLRGDLRQAEEYYRRGLAIRESLAPGSIGVARNLNNLADVTWRQGDLARAEKYGLRAMAMIKKQAPGTSYAAEIFIEQGFLAEDRGDLIKAEEYFRESLAIHEKAATDNLNVADDLNNLGKVLWERRDSAKAEEHLRRALAMAQKVAPDSLYVADSFNRLGDVLQDRGDWVQAKEHYSQALAIREKLVPGSLDHVESLAGLASVMRHTQQPDAAAQLFDRALNALESLVARVNDAAEARSNFRARHSNYYRDYIDLLIAQGKPELAFQVLERSRARSLVELLAEARVDIRKGVDPGLVEKERDLQQSFSAKSNRRIQLLSGDHTPEQLTNLDKDIKDVLQQYQDVEEQIQATSPTYAALTQPQPLSAKDVQQQLLDADTMLLEYSLGKERSYVFALTQDSLTAYELPKQADIEALGRKVYGLLTARSGIRNGETPLQKKARIAETDVGYAKAVTRLGRLILGPVASQLERKRLLIVSDGALQYIPFSILPEPENSSHFPLPLIVGHEIVNLPSASVLAALRRAQVGRKQPLKAVAVLADPVFSTRDARVSARMKPRQGRTRSVSQNDGTSPPDPSEDLLTRSARDLGFLYLPRLPFTRQEAAAIMAVTPAGEGMEALDFRASRDQSMSRELANYRMVHLATHGLVDSEHPELSGLVLSLVDKQGKRQNGFLGLQDIYNLDLPVELVVLSACETGLGKEISGEGLIGLTRGFMYAGASRVVASLWSVDDVATAELMSRFYRGMLRQGLSPAAALRQSQVQMRRQKRWSNPYYWGAFVVQGEWRPENRQSVNE